MYFSLTVTAVLKGSSTCIAAHLLLYWKAKNKTKKGGGGGANAMHRDSPNKLLSMHHAEITQQLM